ncbi:hypothetical protein K461DRAFT_57926 [Myriangium duriaei CBS 260.36]|uniref:Uncharacterized protein n=1 Tax=Myriangium duriaei CBS 260.36 TaxID=1168546 RepID=A0A9P4ISE4_9PEZI|nr:hypothetical protein K461DRAFT_57926 [Myriangium duriaei CBS 260.36]
MGSTGVVLHDALEMQELYNDVRRGWWLYTTPGAFSTFHKDKAGLCTILVVEQGQKDWFVAEDNDPRAGKEGLWPERISGISILQGTLAIQGPGVLHSVFTPVLSKVFGRS